jgi:tRNA-specific adenosine deaminase 1
MKCLPASKLPSAKGIILHDWHAEVLAIRAFNHFVLQECKAIIADRKDSPYLRRNTSATTDEPVENGPYFCWKEGVTLHMYCSEAPCGDASMELTISAQQDASPWEAPLPPHLMPDKASASAPGLALLGRACFGQLGVVRRKPARPDAPPSLSKSCSDKLALKQCTSLLSSLVALLVSPAGIYLSSLVLPENQYSATACERCFSARGRFAPLVAVEPQWGDGYAFRPFAVGTTGLEFEYSRRGSSHSEGVRYVASNLATAWSCNGLEENMIGGVLQGRKQSDARAGSAVSRGKMWILAQEIARQVKPSRIVATPGTYEALKNSTGLTTRHKVKEYVREAALRGWVRNTGDDDFGPWP